MNIDDIFNNLNILIDVFYQKGDWSFHQQFDDFLLSIDKIDEREFVFELCQVCLLLKNSSYIAILLDLIHVLSLKDKKLIAFFNQLLVENWHEQHESLIYFIEIYLDKSSVSFLYHSLSVKNDWLNAVGYYAFHKKVIWAIFKIEGKSSLPMIKSYQYKLDKDLQKDLPNWINRRMNNR